MKNKKVLQGIALASVFAFGLLTPVMAKDGPKNIEPDQADYDDPRFVSYYEPDYFYLDRAPDKVTTSISIHYLNEDGKCGSRELWIWCDGVNGSAYTPTVNSAGTEMEVSFSFTGEYEKFANKKGIFFIVKYTIESGMGGDNGWIGKSANMYIDYEEFKPNANGLTEVWCIPGEGDAVEMYESKELTQMDRFVSAAFTTWKTIEVTATDVPNNYKLYALTAYYMSHTMSAKLDDYLLSEGTISRATTVDGRKKFTINLNHSVKPNVQYLLEGVFPNYPDYKKTKYVGFYNLYESTEFNTYYNYEGNDLGVTYNGPNSTTFKVWAPTAASVRVFLYDSGSPSDYKEEDPNASDSRGAYSMVFRPGGIWEVTITGKDLKNKYYTYSVYNSLGNSETIDPYAKACGIDGKRGMIVDWKDTNPEGWEKIPTRWDRSYGYDIANPNDLSIYETHIRDLTMDETWTGTSMPGTYSAFAEAGTKYSKDGYTVTTGFDHIKDMGVKAIQLIPVFDNDNMEGLGSRSYNWGYNPSNYNCLDGSYATNPYDGAARIKEFKQLVKNYAQNGNHTRIIMDVVYNHVSSLDSHPFTKLMPRYYFRYEKTSNSPYNGSGCGNEVKTEAPMMTKYMVESLCWWAKEYKIKGFRFDLMGLIDWQAIKKAAQELYKIDPDIYLYGEGWTADGSESGNLDNQTPDSPYYGHWGANTWTVYNKLNKEDNMCYVGAFNNYGRDTIAGETGKFDENGFIDLGSGDVGGKSYTIANMLVGYHSPDEGFKDPNQCINYASCHDDFSLFDHLSYGISDDYPKQTCAAVAAVESTIMFSNGVAFMRGGEEIFQDKRVSDEEYALWEGERMVNIRDHWVSSNSYNLSDYTNAFRWDRKISIDGVSTLAYCVAIAEAIKARNEIKKYSKADLIAHNPYRASSPLYSYGQGNGSTVVMLKNNNHYFFLNGINSNDISFNEIATHNKVVFCSNPNLGGYTPKENAIKLGWYTCVCLTK